MTVRVNVEPALLAWARERSGLHRQDLANRFPYLEAWERGETKPTLKQLEKYAQATNTSVGLLLLDEPPEEELPVPDFRTSHDATLRKPSGDLLDTIFLCERRQAWYRDFALENGEPPLPFIGSISASTPAPEAARQMEGVLQFGLEDRGHYSSWSEALRGLVDRAEDVGILVMISGIVGNNTRRVLDPVEFRGFSLVDTLAPVVFINGADTKATQIFTLAHELSHLWIGQSAVDSPNVREDQGLEVERACNRIAAELLVPLEALEEDFRTDQGIKEEMGRLARRYRVSTLVVLRRIFDAGYLSWEAYRTHFEEERALVRELAEETTASQGGNFYNTQPVRASKRFTRAIVSDAMEGRTSYRDAFELLGFRKMSTFERLAEHLGVP